MNDFTTGRDPTNINKILAYTRRGWPVFPIVPNSKKPVTEHGHLDATTDEAQIRKWFGNGSNYNVAIPMGKSSGLWAFDVDNKHPDDLVRNGLPNFAKLQMLYDTLPLTLKQYTPSGGIHYVFKYVNGMPNSGKNLKEAGFGGIDIKTDGGYILVAPSIIDGNPYVMEELPIAEGPEWLARLIIGEPRERAATPNANEVTWTVDEIKWVLDRLDVTEFGSDDAWRPLAMAVHAASAGAAEDVFRRWNAGDPKYSGREGMNGTRWKSFDKDKDKGITARTFFWIARQHNIEIPESVLDRLARADKCEEFAELAGVEQVEEFVPPPARIIRVTGGSLPQNVMEAERHLAEATRADYDGGIYQRGATLCQIARLDATTVTQAIRREKGSLQIMEVKPAPLCSRLTHASRWEHFDGRSKKWKHIDAPDKVARVLSEDPSKWIHIPGLRGIVECPTIRDREGGVLSTSGYDEATGLYFDPGGTEFPDMPVLPTEDDARRALTEINALIEDFPFVDDSSRSVALAMLMTPFVRQAVGTAPMFAVTTPTPGTGKTLLAALPAHIATGRKPMLMAHEPKEDEMKKKILALLYGGSVVSIIDNIGEGLSLKSDSLCAVLTHPTFDGRLLGATKMLKVSTATTWVATGNNLSVEGDLIRRTLMCTIDSNMEHPEERSSFKIPKLTEYAQEKRGKLAIAVLTIVRAYILTGRSVSVQPYGSFEEWSRLVREPLIWLGMADPRASRERMVDPAVLDLSNLLRAWHDVFGANKKTAAEICAAASDTTELNESLKTAVNTVINDSYDTRSLGKYLSKHKNKVVGGLKLEQVGDRMHALLWRVSTDEQRSSYMTYDLDDLL